MRIKEHKNKNNYRLTENGVWVRDFTKHSTSYIDINDLTSSQDYRLLLYNELQNKMLQMQHIDTENITHKNIVIVSDGYGFKIKQHILADLPKDVTIIAVNGALAEWDLLTTDKKQKINYYVVNNPYIDCMGFFPRATRYFPKCISSTRTNPEFTRQYSKKGTMYRYLPTHELKFAGMKSDAMYHIDDYRNPVCAAIGLAYRMGVEKLLLFCCDDSLDYEKPGMIKVKYWWIYPQHLISHNIIDANFYWLKSQEEFKVEIADHSCGLDYKNSSYIKDNDIIDFFKGTV